MYLLQSTHDAMLDPDVKKRGLNENVGSSKFGGRGAG
jgi:hypothetical protein